MTRPDASADDLILPDAELTPDECAFAARIRAFAIESLAPHARAIDETSTFRREMVADLAAAGLLRGPLGADVGGDGWSAMQLAIAHEEIGAVCGNARGFLAVQTGLVAKCLERFGTDAQRARFLPDLIAGQTIGCFCLTELEAGSDVASLQCRATRTADGYSITGHKVWTTNGGVADVAIVFATLDPAKGKDAITAFVATTDRGGLRREPMPGRELGHRGSDHAQMHFDGFRVDADARLGAEGEGFAVAMGGLAAGRLSVAAGAVGIHRAALVCAREHVMSRRQFGKPLAAFQMVQERIADMAAELIASRALVHRCARRRDANRETPADVALAKLVATEAASRAAEQSLLLHGGRGYTSAYPPERLLRDSIALRIYEGTTAIQKSILARALLR